MKNGTEKQSEIVVRPHCQF